MRKLKLRDDASATKLTEPGFVQDFEPGQTHEVPDPVFEDYKDGSLFEAVGEDEAMNSMEAHLSESTVEEVKDYIDATIEDDKISEYGGVEPFLDAVEESEAETEERSGVFDYIDEKRENLKSTENED